MRGASERCFAGRVDVGLREGRRTSPDLDAYGAAGLETAPVNSPWRGQVYKRDLEEEARLDDKLSAAKAAAEARAARPLSEAETYWSKRKEPGAGDLCRARAVNAFAAVERQEMGLAVGDRVLVVRQELLPGAGWIFATRGDESGYVPRNYLVEEETSIAEAVLVKTHTLAIESDAHLTLGPMDWANRGRAIPCTWFFAHVLPVSYTHLTLPTTPYV